MARNREQRDESFLYTSRFSLLAATMYRSSGLANHLIQIAVVFGDLKIPKGPRQSADRLTPTAPDASERVDRAWGEIIVSGGSSDSRILALSLWWAARQTEQLGSHRS
jgi:hypothetical protein